MALFKDMTDAGLVEAYWAERALLDTADRMASAPSATRRGINRQAGNVMRHLRNIDIIVAIGRKRGVRFVASSCGA